MQAYIYNLTWVVGSKIHTEIDMKWDPYLVHVRRGLRLAWYIWSLQRETEEEQQIGMFD